MTLFALGINHVTAPVSLRERFAYPGELLIPTLQNLVTRTGVEEAAILSTCNRTEVYCENSDGDAYQLIQWLADNRQIATAEFQPFLYTYSGHGSIRHMFRVAAGLDSMILGEPQILGQMKTAYRAASEAGTLGKNLGKLFQHTFATAKKVRTDTKIGSSPVSVAFAAIRLSQQIFDNFKQQTALLIGAGETIELCARHLHEQGIGRLIVANRTFDRAHNLASRFNGYAIALNEVHHHLAEADILISSTASQMPILGKGSVESALKQRKRKPIFMVDLAVPRDIEPEVEQLKDIYLYTVDDLRHTIEEGINSRREAAKQAEEIIDTQVAHFLEWLKTQTAIATVKDYRTSAEMIRDQALQLAIATLEKGKSAEEVIQLLAHTLTNKLIHTPSAQIKQAGINERPDLIAAAREIFKLDETETP